MFRFVLIIAPQQVKVPDLARTWPAQFKQIFWRFPEVRVLRGRGKSMSLLVCSLKSSLCSVRPGSPSGTGWVQSEEAVEAVPGSWRLWGTAWAGRLVKLLPRLGLRVAELIITFFQGTARKSKEKESARDGNLGSLPADLKAWAARKASSPSPVRRKARRSRSREKVVAPRNRSRSRERRRRSRSTDVERRKRSRSSDRNRNGEKKDANDVRSNQIKRRKNQRLASDKDRRHNSDSE